MAIPMTRGSGRIALGELAAFLPADSLEEYRVGRLLELRAVIDSLRAERIDRVLFGVREAADRSHNRS